MKKLLVIALCALISCPLFGAAKMGPRWVNEFRVVTVGDDFTVVRPSKAVLGGAWFPQALAQDSSVQMLGDPITVEAAKMAGAVSLKAYPFRAVQEGTERIIFKTAKFGKKNRSRFYIVKVIVTAQPLMPQSGIVVAQPLMQSGAIIAQPPATQPKPKILY